MSEPNYAIHKYILDNIGSQARILELGSGEGTTNLVKLFDKVYTVEHSIEWFNKIPEMAKGIYAPLSEYTDKYYREASWWYDPEVLSKYLPKPEEYDAIIIDGPKGSQGRGGFDTYFSLFNQNCLMVFDDVHRLWDFRLAGRIAQKLETELTVFPGKEGRRWFAVIN